MSFGLAWIAIAMTAAPGPAAWVALSGNSDDAGLFFATFSLAVAAGAALGGRLMDRFGRRPVLAAAHVTAAAGFALAGASFMRGTLAPFIAGTALLALGIGVIYLTRVAAAEMFPPRERARAVGRVQVTATIGAVMGPLLLLASDPIARLVGTPATHMVWYFAPPLLLASAALVLLGPEPLKLAHHAAAAATGPGLAPPRAPRIALVAGIAALAGAQAAMIAVMGVTGVALHDAGHTAAVTSLTMAAHFLGMFGLSPLVGKFADRAGRRLTIAAGVALLLVGSASVSFVAGAVGLIVGLLLIGLGWSFAYIGGTVLLSDVVPTSRRARVIGLTDFGTAILAAGAAFGAGWWYAARGLPGLGLAAIVLVIAPAVLVALLREPRPGHYRAFRGQRAETRAPDV